jgi:hypothetical protein
MAQVETKTESVALSGAREIAASKLRSVTNFTMGHSSTERISLKIVADKVGSRAEGGKLGREKATGATKPLRSR